jgi:hypothetical protein
MKPKTKLFLSLLWRDVRGAVKVAAILSFMLSIMAWLAFGGYKLAQWMCADAESAAEIIVTGASFMTLLCAFIAWLGFRWHQCHASPD